MKKATFVKNLSYIFDADRKGAKYSIDGGQKWMNHGDFCECLAKSVLGFKPVKDANTRSDKGHDLPELNLSIKSFKCGLSDRVDLKALKDPEKFYNQFFADELPNTNYCYVIEYGEFVDLYIMNFEEFKQFVRDMASWDTYSFKFRFNTCDNKTAKYFEEKIGE